MKIDTTTVVAALVAFAGVVAIFCAASWAALWALVVLGVPLEYSVKHWFAIVILSAWVEINTRGGKK